MGISRLLPRDFCFHARFLAPADELVAAMYPNLIDVEKMNPDGSFTTLKENTDSQGVSLLSLDVFPTGP